MELVGNLLSSYWQYISLLLGIGFIVFGIICNKIKLPRFSTRNPNMTHSLGLRIIYILIGIGCIVYSLQYIG